MESVPTKHSCRQTPRGKPLSLVTMGRCSQSPGPTQTPTVTLPGWELEPRHQPWSESGSMELKDQRSLRWAWEGRQSKEGCRELKRPLSTGNRAGRSVEDTNVCVQWQERAPSAA